MAHGTGKLAKTFTLDETWTLEQAQVLDDFLDDVVDTHHDLKTGRYVGTGREQTIVVRGLPGPPVLLIAQKADGEAVPLITLVPWLGGEVTAWNQHGFTLAASAARNLANVSYQYFILA